MAVVPDLTVEQLLRSPALQLSLLAGEAGLSRSISWAHVSELADPTPWLLGAEMIMTTGLAVPRGGSEQRAYLERLCANGRPSRGSLSSKAAASMLAIVHPSLKAARSSS